jgi:hypothetical protein
MNEEYEKFFNKCIAGLGVDRAQCMMKANYCQIRTAKGWVVHYEWWLARNKNLQVCLHFESNNPALNQRRYCKCATLIETLEKEVGETASVAGVKREKNGDHIVISRHLDFKDKDKDPVVWAVSMMRALQKVFEKTIAEMN